MIKPNLVIGVNYLSRWHLIPKNGFLNIYLHKFEGSDDDRALHDHPWSSLSILFKGQIREIYKFHAAGCNLTTFRKIKRFVPVYRPADYAHRLEVTRSPAWTLFITGPRVREWGFLCPKGWKHWKTMSTPDGKPIGGCE